MAATVVKEKPLFHLQVLFTEEFYSGEVTSMRYNRDVTPICHNCCNLYLFMLFAIILVFIHIY